MPYSGTTPNPRRPARIPLWLVVVGDDHPSACTGRRLLRQRTALRAGPFSGGSTPITLDPYARTVLSRLDRRYAEQHGLLVVDCSWNRLSERGRLGDGPPSRASVRRRLPYLLATNPQHYGRWGELNTAEAFAAALAVLGHERQGREVLGPFHGAEAFFSVNEDRLRAYRASRTPEGVQAAERAMFSEHS